MDSVSDSWLAPRGSGPTIAAPLAMKVNAPVLGNWSVRQWTGGGRDRLVVFQVQMIRGPPVSSMRTTAVRRVPSGE